MWNHDFDSSILDVIAHRPWPMPTSPWMMTQTWHDLLFAHWPVPLTAVRARVPRAFDVDTFDGTAWVGVVSFYMTNVALRGMPSLPRLSEFAELNVRTYVRVGDRPGVYFFSLDAERVLAVKAARRLLNLPYYTANMRVVRQGREVHYRSTRESDSSVVFAGAYRGLDTPRPCSAGSLAEFLTERYCLYHVDRRGAPYCLEIHHPPWRLHTAEAQIDRNTMLEASGFRVPARPHVLHFAERQDIVAWPPRS